MATSTGDEPRFTLEEIEEQHAYRLALQIEE